MNTKARIREVLWNELRDIETIARRERVYLTDTQRTVWHAVLEGEKTIGCGAIIFENKSVAKIKTVYVLPSRRSQGLYTMIMNSLIAKAKAAGCTKVYGEDHTGAVWQSLGARAEKLYRRGLTKKKMVLIL